MARFDRQLSVLALVAFAASVDGADPVAVEVPDGLATFRMAALPRFELSASAAEAAALTRARVTAWDIDADTILAQAQQDIGAGQSVWSLDLTFNVSVTSPPRVRVDAELATVEGSQESVEWSGRTGEFRATATAGQPELREVSMYRGPLGNLDITGLDVLEAPTSLLAGGSATLNVSLSGASGDERVYYQSLTPSIATIDNGGTVHAQAAGDARVVAMAGRWADTVSVRVTAIVLPEPEDIQTSVTPQVEFTASAITPTMADAAGASAITLGLGVLASALASGNGAAVVAAFESAAKVWAAYGSGSDLRTLDGLQLSWIELALINTADAIGIPFRN